MALRSCGKILLAGNLIMVDATIVFIIKSNKLHDLRSKFCVCVFNSLWLARVVGQVMHISHCILLLFFYSITKATFGYP